MKQLLTLTPKKQAASLFTICSTILLFSYLMLGVYIMASGSKNNTAPASLQEGIAKEVLRFHVIADSDDEEAQEIKLIIKDALVSYLKPYLSAAKNKQEAMEIILEQLVNLEKVANSLLAEHQFSYTAKAELAKTEFPVKVYGDIALPAGTYDALCIRLGKAEGKNWWCIMFPQLCFLDSSYTILPDTSKEDLKYLLTEEEYNAILINPPQVTYRFKLIDWLTELFS